MPVYMPDDCRGTAYTPPAAAGGMACLSAALLL